MKGFLLKKKLTSLSTAASMELPLYQIDAFTNEIFSGNPACVVPLSKWLSDDLLLKIAKENAVAETAFFVNKGDHFHLKWFTPETEMDLCGHATLAAAHAIKEIIGTPGDTIKFYTQSGDLEVIATNSVYTLNFPSRSPRPVELPSLLSESISIQPKEVLKARDYVLVYEKEEDIKNIRISRREFDQFETGTGGVIFTAEGSDCDFVSRFFTPGASVFEDPVTGSAHCSLIPYWSDRLKKAELRAKQISERGGSLVCINDGERVLISGSAKTYSIGKLWTE